MAYTIDNEKCLGCGACAATCPVSAIESDSGKYKINADVCIECGSCASDCPANAIHK
ncbi:4Fe-4S binding protein [Deferribacterales bacterium RsTz2092]|nr:4Fe-4S ferredoxin [Deferribacterales bacterium]